VIAAGLALVITGLVALAVLGAVAPAPFGWAGLALVGILALVALTGSERR
jgi:hypothetical protein